jgi:hypothetical protein
LNVNFRAKQERAIVFININGIYKMPKTRRTPEERFWKFVDKKEINDCWEERVAS